MKKPKILVTGSRGFLGSNLIPLLEKDFLVIPFHGDICDIENIKKQISSNLHGVIHLAGVIAGSNKTFVEVNIVGTMNLLEVLQNQAPDLAFFISIGSAAEYGAHSDQITESTPCLPNSMYGHSKLIATELIQGWQKYTGVPSIVLRPFNIIGPNQPVRMLPAKLVEFFSQQLPLIQIHNVNKEATRDWIDVRDVSEAIYLLTQTPLAGFEIFNLGLGNIVSNEDLINVFASIWKKDYTIGDTVYSPDQVISNSTKIQHFLNWKPQFTLQDSVQRMYQTLRND